MARVACQANVDAVIAENRRVETTEYAAMLRRMLRSYARRVANADPEDLSDMLEVRDELDEAIATAVHGMRDRGLSWSDVARGAGTTRQAAQQRWRRRGE